jgi:hypothetical protein
MRIIELYKKLEDGPASSNEQFADFMLKKNLWVGRIFIPLGIVVALVGLILGNFSIVGIGLLISVLGIFALIVRRYFMPESKDHKPTIFDDVIFSGGALIGLTLGIGGIVLLCLGFTNTIKIQAKGYIFYFIISLLGFYGFWTDLQKVKRHIKERKKNGK